MHAYASVAHAHRNIIQRLADRSPTPESPISDRNTPQRCVWRAEIILLSADGVGTVEFMRQTGKSKICVAPAGALRHGRHRGSLGDKTRPSRIAPLGPEISDRVVALTLTEPPAETTHWTAGRSGHKPWAELRVVGELQSANGGAEDFANSRCGAPRWCHRAVGR